MLGEQGMGCATESSSQNLVLLLGDERESARISLVWLTISEDLVRSQLSWSMCEVKEGVDCRPELFYV